MKLVLRFVCRLRILTLASLAVPLSAGTIIGNLPPVNEGFGTQIGYVDTDSEWVKAIGFTMGTTDYALTGAALRLECYPMMSTCGDLQSILIGVYADSGANQPGALIANLGYSFALPLPTNFGSYTFSSPAGATLIHGASYWLVLAAVISPLEMNNALIWGSSAPMIAPSGIGATYVGGLLSSDGGATWSASSTANSFELQGDATSSIPEPASVVLFGLGIGGMLLVRKRISRRG